MVFVRKCRELTQWFVGQKLGGWGKRQSSACSLQVISQHKQAPEVCRKSSQARRRWSEGDTARSTFYAPAWNKAGHASGKMERRPRRRCLGLDYVDVTYSVDTPYKPFLRVFLRSNRA